MSTPTLTATTAELRRLAESSRYYARHDDGRRFREIMTAAGFQGRPGGWIRDAVAGGDRPVARGLTALAAIVADPWNTTITVEGVVDRLRTTAHEAYLHIPCDAETLAYGADPELWGTGQADERDIAARHRAMQDGLITSGRLAIHGEVVRHVELGTYGVFDRLERGAAYVWFAGGDPWDTERVHPEDIAVVTVVELSRDSGRWDVTCSHCARLAVLDCDGNLKPHVRRDGIHPSICGGSGKAPFAHDRTGLIQARLYGPDRLPASQAAAIAADAKVYAVAVVEIDGLQIPVDHRDETTDGDRLAEALARAGYEPAWGAHPYDNLFEDGSAIMLRARQ